MPGGQTSQVVEPEVLATLPGEQAGQRSEPTPLLKLPGGQGEHLRERDYGIFTKETLYPQ